MNTRCLYAAAIAALGFSACKTSGGAPAGKGSVALDASARVAEVDGRAITYGELEADKEAGLKLRQAEVKALTDLYEQRRAIVDEYISRRLVEDEARSRGKTLEQWLQSDYTSTVPETSDAEARAFYEEHKSQMPKGQSYEELKPRIQQFARQQKLREGMGKMLEQLKEKHHVQIALQPPQLPRIEVEAKGPSRGPADAPVTVVEFSDFQCPYCGREAPVIDRVMKEYEGKVKLVFRNFPLDLHPFAAKAAEAGACAADQGKFWELHDRMFANQQKLGVDDLKGYAKAVGIDQSRFDKCLDSGEKKPLVDSDMKAGTEAGVSGTPAFFINGIFINGAQPYEQLKQTVERELKKKG